MSAEGDVKETTVDAEIEAIEACVASLEPLVEDSQDRILDYLCARYGRKFKDVNDA